MRDVDMNHSEIETAYQSGEAAYHAGVPSSENPFPMEPGGSAQHKSWYDGWYDQQISKRLDPIFAKYETQWLEPEKERE